MENICEWENCREIGNLKHRLKEIIAEIINGYVKNILNCLIKNGTILKACRKSKLKIL